MVEANNYNHYLASLIDIDLQLHFRVLDFGQLGAVIGDDRLGSAAENWRSVNVSP
jgi:hypothetical protein